MNAKQITSHLFLLILLIQACDKESDPGVRKQQSGTIETFAGMGPQQWGYAGDGGIATNAKLGWVIGIAVDSSNNVYVADGAANTIRMIVSSHRMITTVAGTFLGFNVADQTPYSGDGGVATKAHLNMPMGLSVDVSGNIIIADAGNNVIRQVTSDTRLISTICGNGSQGYSGDGDLATSADLFVPHNIAVDAAGNIYFSDAQNNVIRMITKSTGKIATLAGLGPDHEGYSGDKGPATEAKLNFPEGVAVDKNGNIYIADSNNNVIRKISSGIITTIAGTGADGYSGDGGLATRATFSSLKGIAVDSDGNIYIADSGNSVIRKINTTGIISTIAGNGTMGYSGDGAAAVNAQLSNPWSVAVDKDGNVYIADSGNSAIRVVAK